MMATTAPLIAPSLLSCDFARLAEEIARAEDAGADWLHVDVMDGHFVPNLTIGPPVVEKIRDVARVPLDVHLMISEPARYAEAFVHAGAHVLTFHAECAEDTAGRLAIAERFRELGVPQVGVALNPDTPVETVAELLEHVDLVLVMSVFPGFGGQAFMPEVLSKPRWLRQRGYRGWIEMDGGLAERTIPLAAASGTNVLVSGSALFGAADLKDTMTRFRELAEASAPAKDDLPLEPRKR